MSIGIDWQPKTLGGYHPEYCVDSLVVYSNTPTKVPIDVFGRLVESDGRLVEPGREGFTHGYVVHHRKIQDTTGCPIAVVYCGPLCMCIPADSLNYTAPDGTPLNQTIVNGILYDKEICIEDYIPNALGAYEPDAFSSGFNRTAAYYGD